MALQASGPIKYSEIREEFGDPIGSSSFSSYNVGWTYWSPQTAWVKSSDGAAGWYNSGVEGAWSQFMIDHAVYPSNTDPLVGTHQGIWRLGGESMSLLPADTYTLECQCDNLASFTLNETFLGEIGGSTESQEWQTVFPMGYTAGQNYIQLFQGVFTIFYQGVEIGELTTIPTQIDNRKYYGGNLVVDNGNTWQNPSYYELKVEALITIINNAHNTSTTFNFTTFDEIPSYLICNVSNSPYQTPETGVTFDENGNLVTGPGSTNTLIRISIGWDDEAGVSDLGYAWERYQIPELGIDFKVKNAGGEVQYWGARTQVVEVEPNRTYTAVLNRGVYYTRDADNNLLGPFPVDNAYWRHNNNQRFCIPDQGGTDANAQIWISAPNKVFPISDLGGGTEITEIINRDKTTGSWPGVYYWPSDDGNTENNGEQGLFPDELDEDGNPTGSKLQIRGMVNPEIMASDTTWNLSGWDDTGVPTVAPGDPNDWNINPAGVAWELKNSSGTVIRRSSDSFNYTYPSYNWGTLLQNYSVYPSTVGSLVNQWHEANYLFDTNSNSTYTIEASADSQFQILLVENGTGNSVDVLSSENSRSCNTGSCPTSTALTITPNSKHRLRVRVLNESSDIPYGLPISSWLYNPGGIAFIIKDSSGRIIKTSRDTGDQGTIESTPDGIARFGNYRISESYGSVSGVPLDSDAGRDFNEDIPTSGPIKFSNFYNARLNMAIDYYTGDTEYKPETGRTRYNDSTKVRVVGGFKERIPPTGGSSRTAGKKVLIVIDKTFGGEDYNDNTSSNSCSIRTGADWDSETMMDVIVGSNGKVYGTGGNGGDVGCSKYGAGKDGAPGLSAIGIQFEGVGKTGVDVRSGALLRAGYGGGGGGAGAWGDHNEIGKDEACGTCGGGGGGGAGLPAGKAGHQGHDRGGPNMIATDGTLDEGGRGGYRNECSAESQEVRGGNGGRGGDPLEPAADGGNGSCDNDGECRPGVGGEAGGTGAAIRRESGFDLELEINGQVIGSTDAIGVA